ncbi:MAG: tetratricopeptide repeat protein [Nannocystaceae bacterium]
MSIKNDPGVAQALAAAIRAAEASPDSDDAWDHLESLADAAQRPDDVARAYRDLLRTSLSSALRTHLAERAVRFHDEWYGDQPQAISDLLLQIIERDPQARWALDRLTVALTAREDWDALLAVYDRVLVHVTGEAERREILGEAARVAKEFADKPELAADYLLKQLAVDRDNQKLQASVERLLERLERWRDLVGLWEGQATELPPVEARELRLKIAAAYVERLGDPQRALAELRALLDESPGNKAACAALERLLSLETATVELRKGALALLRKSYDAAGRSSEVLRLLGVALRFAEIDDRPPLLRELANRRALAGDDAGAMEGYGEVLRLTPSDGDARKQLRQIAARTGRHDLHAGALFAAAGATEGAQRLTLLVDAAQIRQGALGDLAGAAALYREILDAPEIEAQTASIAAHSLASLLGGDDQREERLAVLERLADLEATPAIRLAILGEAADLAESLGKRQRALGIWMHRLDQSPADVAAMSAVIRLLEALERWSDLVKALLRRADAPVIRLQRRADLLKAAEIEAFRIGNIDAAIDLLLGVREGFGEDPEVLAALDRQLTACARFSELAGLLERSARTSASHTGWLYVRAAEIQLRDLEDNLAAARLYAEALSLDPGRREAIDGLREVIGDERCVEISTMSLIGAFKRTDDWEGMLGLVEHRLRLADNDHERARILGEAAYIQERRAHDPVGARATLGRSLIAEPSDVSREHELLRLAKVTGAFRECADTLGAAAERAADTPARAAQLWYSRGLLLAGELDDIHEATLAYARAAELEPQRRIYQEAAARAGAQASLWEIAARAAVQALNGHEAHDQTLLGELDQVAREKGAEASVAAAATRAAVELAEALPPASARRLERTIAAWYDVTGDADRAIAATRRALERDPGDLETLRELATRIAGRPATERIDVLLKIDAVAELDLDALREAAGLAVEHEGEADEADGAAVEIAKNTVYRLYRKAARMWSRGESATGSVTPESSIEWALADLTRRASPEVAARLLLDCATLPVSAERSRELRRRAAELLAGQGQRARAIDLYFGILSEGEETLADILRVAGLCEEEGRTAELLELRTRELAHERDPGRRLHLRLTIAALAGELETRDSRIAALRANLAEKPGHPETLEILQTVLAERGRFAELAEVLEDQARQVAVAGDEAAAAGLWSRTAQIAEEALSDPERAIAAYTRVVDVQADHHAIDALARLHLQREEPAQAALWLKRRIEGAAAVERVPILLKLARAQIKAGDQDAAIEALQAAFAEAPRSGEVRRLLLGLLREKGDPTPLAHALATSAQNVSDSAMVLAFAREAAELFEDKIGAPELAVPVLEKAIPLAGDDRTLKIMLARGLLSSGRLPEAKELLAQIIDGFGRRRSPERAQIHLLLAQVLHAEDEVALAIDQLEAASSMDPGNIAILTNLAELAQQSGQLARAERAYRTLLVNIRRTDLTGDVEIGPAEVLLKLSRIAQARGQDDKAVELVESVIDAIGESDDEAARIQDDLRARGDLALLRRVLEARLGHAQGRLRAEVLGELADLLDGDLNQPEQALDARLRALEADPGAPERHDAARGLAERLGRLDRYADHVAGLLETTRRPSDAHARCELLLRLGEALEATGELARAADLFIQAEATGVRQIDVWRAGARVAAARGDTETQVRLLGLLARLGASEDESRVDALYRVAEIQLASPATEEAGLDALSEALAEDPRPSRAAIILQQASERGEPSPRLLALYEDVARKAGDDALLLHALERRAAAAGASAAIVREGVDLAIRTGQGDRADALLGRALELGHGIPWALLALARRKIDQGDLAAAVRYLGEAIEPAELGEVLPLAQEVCDLSLREGGDPTLSAPLYQRLLEREGAKRAIWEPLCGIYRALGDVARLDQLVSDLLDGLEDPRERNVLRLALVDALTGREGREADVSTLLRAALADDSSDASIRARLTDHLRSVGDQEGLQGLLRDELAAAEAAGDGEAVRTLTIQLAAGLREGKPEEALALAHAALAAAPEDRELLRLVLDLGDAGDSSERGALMERLLIASAGDEAAAIARELHQLRKGADDPAGARRALELGVSRAPGDQSLFDLLEAHLREGGDARALAHLLAESAKTREESYEKADLLREAALILRDREGDPQGAAVLLMDAAEADPSDPAVKLELAATLSMAGDLQAALETIEAGLQSSPDLAQHVAFLRCRAGIQIKVGQLDAALADLDEAYSIDPDVTFDDMIDALEAAIQSAERSDDLEGERALIFRLADLHLAHNQEREARERLAGWVSRAPADVDGMTRLWRLDAQAEDWESVINIGSKLIIMATGKLQVEAALALADASIQMGRSQAARFGLEYVRSKQPEDREVREKLAQLYEHLGAVRELAGLLLEDASQQQNPAMRLQTLRRAADMLLDHGDRLTLIPVLAEIVALDPADRESALTLAGVHLQAGNLDDADVIVSQIIASMGTRRSPELGQMHYRKALIARAKGDRDHELQHLQEALQNDKDNGLLAAELAELAEAVENWDVAMRVLRTITMMESGECPISKAQAYARQARIAHRTGDPKRAIFWARRATQEDPELEEAHALLRHLEQE